MGAGGKEPRPSLTLRACHPIPDACSVLAGFAMLLLTVCTFIVAQAPAFFHVQYAKFAVRYLVFDIESVADAAVGGQASLCRRGAIDPAEAVRRYRDELMEKYESDFIPYSFQMPISVVVGKVTADFRLEDVVVLDEPQFRPHVITENFWRGWEKYRRPTLVSFNGRGFDLPLLELAAFRYGMSVPGWFQAAGKSFDQPRNRYNTAAHIDLCELLTNFGSTRFTGGLNLAANLLGKPGKMDDPRRHGPGHVRRRPAGRDQRLLPLRRAGHVLRLPPHARAAGPTDPGGRAAIDRRDQEVARKQGRQLAGLPAVSRPLGRLAEPVDGGRALSYEP